MSNTGGGGRGGRRRRPRAAPRHGTRHADDPDQPQGRPPGRSARPSRASSRGRRRRFAKSSCATASTSFRRRSGRASSCATATRATCSSRACSTAAPRSRSVRWSSTCPSTRDTSSCSRTTRSGAARRLQLFTQLDTILQSRPERRGKIDDEVCCYGLAAPLRFFRPRVSRSSSGQSARARYGGEERLHGHRGDSRPRHASTPQAKLRRACITLASPELLGTPRNRQHQHGRAL